MTKIEYLLLIEELILFLNDKLKHDLVTKYTEYTFNGEESFEADLICKRCDVGFELDIAENTSFYHNEYGKRVSFEFTSIDLFGDINNCSDFTDCMNFTCDELIIKNIIE